MLLLNNNNNFSSDMKYQIHLDISTSYYRYIIFVYRGQNVYFLYLSLLNAKKYHNIFTKENIRYPNFLLSEVISSQVF